MNEKHEVNPPQEQQHQPGKQAEMRPEPETIREDYIGAERLSGRVALVTGGDSGIGRAVAVHFAREGADVAVAYLSEDADAKRTVELVEMAGQRCKLIRGDLRDPEHCRKAVEDTIGEFKRLDVLVNNHGEQHVSKKPEELTPERVLKTFQTNVFSFFNLIDAALPHMKQGACILNTASVVAVRGHATLLDYSATKGAILTLTFSLTFSLAQALAERGIRVNAVAPGPIWTPLIPSSFDAKQVAEFGSDTLMGRPGQPSEVAPAYVFLASQDASYITGQAIHVNGGARVGV